MEEERREKEARADGYINLMNKYGTRDDTSEQYRFQSEGSVTDMSGKFLHCKDNAPSEMNLPQSTSSVQNRVS